MAEYLIQDTTLDAIADAINAKTGGSSAMTPAEMVTAIGSISGGGGLDVARLVPGTYTFGSVDTDGFIHSSGNRISIDTRIPLTKPFDISVGDAIKICFPLGQRQYISVALYNGATTLKTITLSNVTPPVIKGYTIGEGENGTVDSIGIGYQTNGLDTKLVILLNNNIVLT